MDFTTIKELDEEIKSLEKEKSRIEKEISELKLRKEIMVEADKFANIKTNKDNLRLFDLYLHENKGLEDISARKYHNSLDKMKELILEYLKINISVDFYYIDDIKIFQDIIDLYNSNVELISINLRRHHDISAAYNNYYNFLDSKQEEESDKICRKSFLLSCKDVATSSSNEELYKYYLGENCGLTPKSISNYITYLRYMRRLLNEQFIVELPVEIYTIKDDGCIKNIMEICNKNEYMLHEDERTHHHMSCATKKYIEFLNTMKEI